MKSNIKPIIVILLIVINITIAGCSSSKLDSGTIVKEKIEDPFVDKSIKPEKEYNGGYHVKQCIDEVINYDGKKISFNLEIKNSPESDIELGFLVFINGVPQVFDNKSTISNISLKKKEKKRKYCLSVSILIKGKKENNLDLMFPLCFFQMTYHKMKNFVLVTDKI